jgi:hypothetical protein
MTARASRRAASPKGKKQLSSPATRIAADRIAVANAATRKAARRAAARHNPADTAAEDAILNAEITANADSIAKLEELMLYTFGVPLEEGPSILRKRNIRTHLYRAARIVRLSEIEGKLAEWRLEDQVPTVGRKASISPLQAIIIMQAHMSARRGLTFSEMAFTLYDDELRGVDFAALGIVNDNASETAWYQRLWRAVQVLMTLVDSTPGPRWRIPTGEEYQAIIAGRDAEECAKKALRLDDLCNRLIAGSNRLLPQHVLDLHDGNHAIDGTHINVYGKALNPSVINSAQNGLPRKSTNYFSGIYSRGGNHSGYARRGKTSKATKGMTIIKVVRDAKAAMEAELMVKVPNSPYEAANFPLIVQHIGFHRPGESKDAMRTMLTYANEAGTKSGLMLHDRLYSSGMKTENYHEIAYGFGWEFVSDYKKSELGQTDFSGDAIQVGGNWYHKGMPPELVNAEITFDDALKATPWTPDTAESERKERLAIRVAALAQRNISLKARDEWRLLPKGRRQLFESQRYMFPAIATGPQLNLSTGVITASECPKTISIPWKDGLKQAQRYPHRSPEWSAWFGKRNVIESMNAHIKDSNWEAIDDGGRRRARGNTFMYLATTMAVVSANVRKIHTFLMGMRRGVDKKIASQVESVHVLSTRWANGESPSEEKLPDNEDESPPLTP